MNRIGEIDLHSSTLITLERGALRAPLREMGSQSLSTTAIIRTHACLVQVRRTHVLPAVEGKDLILV